LAKIRYGFGVGFGTDSVRVWCVFLYGFGVGFGTKNYVVFLAVLN